ncbi:MAG: HAD hydrolase-like protein [Oscillospiraceae bacterium]|nr:HAD hydrolase-like protein [Oscillospiraceae bacterium]
MKFDLCLFDLDGTLTDPKLGITKSYQYALSAFGIHEELEDLTRFIGPPLRDVFRGHYGFSLSDAEALVAKFREYFSTRGLLENSVYPGIEEVLARLKSAGVLMAVATSKVRVYAKQILENFQLDGYFSFVSGDDMAGNLTRNGKRELIRLARNALDPTGKMSAVIIGDREHDVFGGRDAKIPSIGVIWGYGSRRELENAGATWIVDSTDELYQLLGAV